MLSHDLHCVSACRPANLLLLFLTRKEIEMSQLFFQDDYYSIYTSERNIGNIQMRNEVLIVPLTDQQEVILTIEPLLPLESQH